MATKKSNPAVAARKAARQKFVSEKVASKGISAKQGNQRFYVQTRMAEMKAKGKTVTPEMRKQLQQKFQSGNVARKGFAAPAKKAGVVKPVVTTPVTKSASSTYTYTGQSGKADKRTLTPATQTKPAYSRAQIIRNNESSAKAVTPAKSSASSGYGAARSTNQFVRRAEGSTPGKKPVIKKK